MEQSSNAEKQARYRKKEKLRHKANQMLRLWQLEPKKNNFKSEQEIHQLIESVIKLPHGWTDDDYLNAERKLENINSEIFSPDNQILNDIKSSRGIRFTLSNDIQRITLEKALERTNALACHIISALKISDCDESEQAAALMEAMRFVGRTLSSNSDVHYYSQATAMCLATINSIYDRPKWFARELSSMLYKQTQPELLSELIKYLKQYEERFNGGN